MGGVEEAGRNREGERLSQNLTSKRGGLLEGGELNRKRVLQRGFMV